jgi:Spy/CpxP family protein refolding chaperone
MIARLRGLIAACLLLAASAGSGQQPQPDDPMAQHLFPPDLVMKHASEIGLDDGQKKKLREVFQALQTKMVDSQWTMQEETEKLLELLRARAVDEHAALAQADRVMTLEREIKRMHLQMLVRIKNMLTEVQQNRLKELRGRPAR